MKNMKKQLLTGLLSLSLLLSLMMPVKAIYTAQHTDAADALYNLGLFQGMGTDSMGEPIYNLGGEVTRAQALVMLVRLLGEEDRALNYSYGGHPFTDVSNDHWAYQYVAYCYYRGYVRGVSETKMDPNGKASRQMYLAFLLRALGYRDDQGDFSYNLAHAMAVEVGIFNVSEFEADNFLRDDMVLFSFRALSTKLKTMDYTLGEVLYSKHALDHVAAVNHGFATEEKVVIYANTTQELISALRSNVEIRLSPDTVYSFGEDWLILEDLQDVIITGKNGSEIVTASGASPVIELISCRNIQLTGLSIGHVLPEENSCFAEVLDVSNCLNVNLLQCDLYGCGFYGFIADKSAMTMRRCVIRDCASTIGFIWSSTVDFINCTIKDNGYISDVEESIYHADYAFSILNYLPSGMTTALSFTDCMISGNMHDEFLLDNHLELGDNRRYDEEFVILANCVFIDNRWEEELQG